MRFITSLRAVAAVAMPLMLTSSPEADAQFCLWYKGETVYRQASGTPDSATFSFQLPETPASQTADPSSVGGAIATADEAVDLGLSVKWAPWNVGAKLPGEAGAYFAWGEVTADKSRYSWDYYKWTEDGGSTFTKYTTDGLTDLENADDAAAVNWGGKWVMPNRDQLKELFDNCSIEWKAEGEHAEGSLAGYRLTSKTNGASLFLPAAGLHWLSQHYDLGSYGYYWSAELCLGNSDYTHSLYFNSDNWHLDYNGRNCGQPVRPVICSSAK